MIEHAPAERFVTVARHRLKRVAEVAVVITGADRDTAADRGVEFARVEPPVLARVSAEEELVQLPSDARENRLFGVVGRPGLFNPARQKFGGLPLRKMQAEEPVQRRSIDRDRNETVAHARQHAVLVWPPRRKARDVLDDGRRIRMKDVRAESVPAQARTVDRIVGVPGEVGPLVDDQYARAEFAR